MSRFIFNLAVFSVVGCYCLSQAALAKQDLTLKEVLNLTTRNHPALEAAKFRELSSEKGIEKAQSAYYPKLSAMAIASQGFPSSSGALGIGGLMASPYRKGPAAGLLLEQNLYDFGRTSSSVAIAEKNVDLTKTESKISEIQIAMAASEIFYTCAKDFTLAADYRQLLSEAKDVEKEVKQFVRTGQKSIVEGYLSESQAEEVLTLSADFEKRALLDRSRLSTLTGKKMDLISCPELTDTLFEEVANNVRANQESVYLARAKADVEVSSSEINRARKDYYPKLVGVASIGYLDDTYFGTQKQNYAVGVGLIIPLFEGFKTNATVEEKQAKLMQKEKEVAAAERNLEETNLAFQRQIDSSALRLEHFKHESEISEKAFALSKKRYTVQQGTLSDLREALRNVSRSRIQLRDAQAEFLTRSSQKALLNGALVFAESK
jgi:outer membrane protein